MNNSYNPHPDIDSPLKGIICLYSGSGNTRLACQYIKNSITSAQFELFDITSEKIPDFDSYAVAGFATFTDFIDPPYLFKAFLEKITLQNEKPAFIFNTCAAISGKTLKTMHKWVTAKGFKVIQGHSLRMPESYPPAITAGRGYEQAPNGKKLVRFKRFIEELEESLLFIARGEKVRAKKAEFNLSGLLLPAYSRTHAKRKMGSKYIDVSLCNECGLCEKICPYKAVKLVPKPVFDESKCYGCWRCYNRCPRKAIYTAKYRGKGHYPGPAVGLKKKFSINEEQP
jgi:ferredoxin/flavodoxin